MESNKIELIQSAIQQLIESKQVSGAKPLSVAEDDDEYLHLLTNLLSQLESLKDDGILKPSEPSAEPNELPSCAVGEVEVKSKDETEPSSSNTGAGAENFIKELKKLERQNRITHWLLSGLIVLTVVWQLSEVSLLLKLKQGVTHPFKAFGSMVIGALKRQKEVIEPDNESSTKQKEKKLLNMDIPGMLMNSNDEE